MPAFLRAFVCVFAFAFAFTFGRAHGSALEVIAEKNTMIDRKLRKALKNLQKVDQEIAVFEKKAPAGLSEGEKLLRLEQYMLRHRTHFRKFHERERRLRQFLRMTVLVNHSLPVLSFELVRDHMVAQLDAKTPLLRGVELVDLLQKGKSQIPASVQQRVVLSRIFRFADQISTQGEGKGGYPLERLFAWEKAGKKERTPFTGECGICRCEEPDFRLACAHATGRVCFKDYIAHAQGERRYPIRCPYPECKRPIVVQDLLDLGYGRDEILRWQEAELVQMVKSAGQYKVCTGIDCPEHARYAPGLPKEYSCYQCGSARCLPCNAAHSGESCQDYEARAKTMDDFSAKLGTAVKLQFCPFCATPAERVEDRADCNHMHCVHCKKEWLWVANAKVGKPWVSYEVHDARGETFDSQAMKRKWEQANRRQYFGKFVKAD